MKKNDLKKLAILGVSSGLLIVNGLIAEEAKDTNKSPDNKEKDPNEGNVGYYLMTEEQLLLELNPEGIKKYKELSEENKILARKVASARCDKANACKGLNACKSDHNDCAGKGKCKGQGICAVSDKNLAVKLVHDRAMKEKREKLAEPK